MRPRYSFVIPICNEAGVLPELERRLREVLGQLDADAEVILVDDGSVDGSAELMDEIHRRDPRFKVIRFTRNFGHQMAVTAGLDRASGDATIVLDGDLQDPPELALDLIAKWRDGYEIVYAIRSDRRSEPLLRRTVISLFYRLLHRLANIELPPDAGDFRLVDRTALDQFRQLRESNRYVRGLFAWTGYRSTGVPYRRDARYAGKTKYPVRKLVTLGVDGLIGFSRVPLQIAVVVGFLVSASSFVFGIVAIALRIAGIGVVPGWASVVVAVSFLGGVQLVVTGMMGTYVGRIYEEVKARPLYLVREAKGFEGEHLSVPAAARISEPPIPR